MQGFRFKHLVFGFVAGALAAISVHELVKLLVVGSQAVSSSWDLGLGASYTVAGLPRLANAALWGGLWGIVFSIVFGAVPEGSMTLRGAVLGILGPAIAVSLLIAPLLRGTAPFLGGDVPGVLAVLATFAAFGAATAWLYGYFTAGCTLPGALDA
jgi:hypothetical protein